LHRQRENPAREGPAGGQLTAPIDQQGFDAGLPMVHNQTVELQLLLGLGIDDPFAARTSVRAAALVGFRPKFDQPVAMPIWRWEVGISRARAMHLPHVLQIDQAEIGELLCRLEDLEIR
jgi:hypothetical protein